MGPAAVAAALLVVLVGLGMCVDVPMAAMRGAVAVTAVGMVSAVGPAVRFRRLAASPAATTDPPIGLWLYELA